MPPDSGFPIACDTHSPLSFDAMSKKLVACSSAESVVVGSSEGVYCLLEVPCVRHPERETVRDGVSGVNKLNGVTTTTRARACTRAVYIIATFEAKKEERQLQMSAA